MLYNRIKADEGFLIMTEPGKLTGIMQLFLKNIVITSFGAKQDILRAIRGITYDN
jgi:hypothetical protein